MRRADRLFQIVQLLRGKRAVTARRLAERLDVSVRTIYRDMQDLSLSGVPILGEAGSGYRLLPGFEHADPNRSTAPSSGFRQQNREAYRRCFYLGS